MDQARLLRLIEFFRLVYGEKYANGSIEQYSDKTFDQIFKLCEEFLGEVSFEDKKTLKRKVDSEYQIYQPDPIAILDDYEHQDDWFTSTKDEKNLFYWLRYKQHLFNVGFPHQVLEKLDYKTTDKLIDLIGNPNENVEFSRKGLVMGDVQSGKTSNYIGLICKAADVGFKVIILLTGTLESLRVQTQIRVEEGFIGYDSIKRTFLGVGKNAEPTDPLPIAITSRSNDFTGNSGQNTSLKIDNTKIPLIFVTKKNPVTLKKIKETILNLNLIPPEKKINASLLIVDDEADNASVNTNKLEYDPTKINAEIRDILSLFTRSSYVGFTATPFANVFIDPESESEMLKSDLFPKDFIFALDPPSNYFGSQKIFLDKSSKFIVPIEDYDDSFALKHKKEWDGDHLFPSLTEAINAFLIANSIRDLNEEKLKNSHRSMLINISRFINVQNKIEDIVSVIFQKIHNSVYLTRGMNANDALKNSFILALHNVYKKYYSSKYNWNLVFESLFGAIKDIKVFKVPNKNKNKVLDYELYKSTGLRVIVIGGLALSRGLTLEGLTISYLYRNTSTFDVLMQMGRWFGYRDKPIPYEDLCLIWMLDKTKEYFKEISTSINELKNDIKSMVESKKPPIEFGIRVRNESDSLGITNVNKMRTSKKYVYNLDYLGNVLETPFIDFDLSKIEENMGLFKKFIKSLNLKQVGPNRVLSKNLEVNEVIKLLKEFHIHDANKFNYFDKEQLISFILNHSFPRFDVGVIGGEGNQLQIRDEYKVNIIERSFDIFDTNAIRISGAHRKIGGPSDTKLGLPEELEHLTVNLKSNNKKYLVEGRNPLVLFYPIQLKVTNIDLQSQPEKSKELLRGVNLGSDNYLVGMAIAFPNNSALTKKRQVIYMINRKTSWFNAMKEEGEEV